MWRAVLFLCPLLLLLVSATSPVVVRWWGAGCCRQALVPRCRSCCRRAASASELRVCCRQSHEPELFRCLQHRKRGKNGTAEAEPDESALTNVLGCCRRATAPQCAAACLSLQRQRSSSSSEEIHRQLSAGPCATDVSLWKCVAPDSRGRRQPSRQLEVQCCHLAASVTCRQLCHDTYSSGWHHQGPRLERQCLSSQYGEVELRRCIRDAESPCQPNSGQLQFCGRLTQQSTGLYRDWSHQADHRAKTQYINWVRSGKLDVPLPTRSIVTTAQCRSELRRLACFLHLQPCHSHRHGQAQLCSADCRHLSERCLEQTSGRPDVDAVCSLLTGPDHSCVRLPQREPTPEPYTPVEVRSPCEPSPCRPGQVCRLAKPNQAPHVCRPGCRLSMVSPKTVEEGATVLLPAVELGKLSLLTCAPGGLLVECRRLSPPQLLPCDLFGSKVGSGETRRVGCRICTCIDGQPECRQSRECSKSATSGTATHHRQSRCLVGMTPEEDPCREQPCPPGFHCQTQLNVNSDQSDSHHSCVARSGHTVTELVARCRESQPEFLLPDPPQTTGCTPAQDCQGDAISCSSSNISCSSTAPRSGHNLKLYFSGRRLAALQSPVSVRSVLDTLQRLVVTAGCCVHGRLDTARRMTITVAATGASAALERACRLETDKLRAWLVTASPTVSVEPSLWPVVYAELESDGVSGGTGRQLRRTHTAVILVSSLVLLLW